MATVRSSSNLQNMPELPEVETIMNDLKAVLRGACFEKVEIFNNRSVVGDLGFFVKLRGEKITKISRRGKFINIFFVNDLVITFHLRMTGRIIANKSSGSLKHERVRLIFNKVILHFCDVRKFGRIWIAKKDDYELVTGISKLGIEPLSPEFSFEKFIELVRGKKGSIKSFLLKQHPITGIGNIYADEACFYANLRPDSRLENLTKKDLKSLFESIKKALIQGVENRGTSVSDFIDTKGQKGRNQELLYVYKRAGQPCLICHKKLQKIKLASRTTVFCSNCQKKK